MQIFRRDNEEGKLLLGDSAHPAAWSHQPGGAPRGTSSKSGRWSTHRSLTVTPGKGRELRREPGGQAATAEPGRGVPADAAAARPGSSVTPAAPGRGDACSAALCDRGGLCSSRHRGRAGGRSVPAPRRRRARRCPQRSGQTRRGAGLAGSRALPCLGLPLYGGPR